MLFEVSFYKKWSQEVLVVLNVFSNNIEDAVGLLIDLDNNEEESLGLEDLEYSAREI